MALEGEVVYCWSVERKSVLVWEMVEALRWFLLGARRRLNQQIGWITPCVTVCMGCQLNGAVCASDIRRSHMLKPTSLEVFGFDRYSGLSVCVIGGHITVSTSEATGDSLRILEAFQDP